MLSYTGRRNMFGNLCNNSASSTLTLADTLMNDSERRLLSMRDWPFLWRQYTSTTVAAQQAYQLPMYTQKPQSVYVTVGSYRYAPKEVTNRDQWDTLNQVVISSNIATHYFVYDDKIELFPVPASSSNTITFNARRIIKDLSIADYTTGNIDIITNGSSAVTGAGTPNWTTPMAGRWLRVTASNTAASSGDGYWYEISSIGSATTLTLYRKYAGTSLTTGAAAAYIIGEVSLLPEPHQQLSVFEALSIYFTSVDPNPTKAALYAQKSKEGQAQLFRDYTSKASVVLNNGNSEPEFINPNLLVTL